MVKYHIKGWLKNRKVPANQVKELEDGLASVDRKTKVLRWSQGLRQERLSCLMKLWSLIYAEEMEWRQISRVKWLKEGDRNTKFFHLIFNVRRKSSFVGELLIDGRLCKGLTQVREGVFSFFRDHFKKVGWKRQTIKDLAIIRISEE
ncbi:hypothetical protein Dsin_025296 [Dipteronia sinensis]|uniref:Uncharacterized protein n=1 Tax=Dipteronia sinensis TaxID=43782 RepID=A0AAD9ZW51_9ROSI|nr:hypothetical protein Dsin_025296 [Dipteronia sinensis]